MTVGVCCDWLGTVHTMQYHKAELEKVKLTLEVNVNFNCMINTLEVVTFSIEINDQNFQLCNFSCHQLFQLQLCLLCHTVTLKTVYYILYFYITNSLTLCEQMYRWYLLSRGTYLDLGQTMQTINIKCLWFAFKSENGRRQKFYHLYIYHRYLLIHLKIYHLACYVMLMMFLFTKFVVNIVDEKLF